MNGVLLVDKAPGMTSHDVVAKARRILGTRSIGHAGTLDPMASGLLCLLVGEATKISDYLLNGDKGYEVTVRLGVRTDSMDITGQVIEEKPADVVAAVTDAQVREAVLSASGDLELAVPIHSAVKVDGKKLYEFAHKGERPEDSGREVPVRTMSFYDVELLKIEGHETGREVTAKLKCSKGSFIRAWAEHVGQVLGCGGTVSALRRVLSAPYTIDQAATLEVIQERWDARPNRDGAVIGSGWVPLEDALPHFNRLEVAGYDATLLKNGQISKGLQADLLRLVQLGEQPKPVRIIHREERRLLALLAANPGEFYKIRRVFV